MSLSTYLAQKYLTASTPDNASNSTTSKKRKRKHTPSNSGLIIADDDALGWSTNTRAGGGEAQDSIPLTIHSSSAEFRKAKKNAWKVVGIPVLQPKDEDGAAADQIIAEASKERVNAGDFGDEAPVLVDTGEGLVKMADGTHAGLQRAEDVKRQFEEWKKEEKKAWDAEQEALDKKRKGTGKDMTSEETVYRDATGRRIDISMRRQEKKRELDEKERKEREEKEMQQGDVQIALKGKRREELDEARFLTLARGVDDESMNKELKERERWNDPAIQFLKGKNEGRGGSGKPSYKGAAAPNRYGIRPGHRWDGVDRGNGWEAERFKGINRKARNRDLGFAWEMDE